MYGGGSALPPTLAATGLTATGLNSTVAIFFMVAAMAIGALLLVRERHLQKQAS